MNSLNQAAALYEALLDRTIEPEAAADWARQPGSIDPFLVGLQLQSSTEYMDRLLRRAQDAHLLLIHRARLLMVRRLLPAAARILDLGGANGPLYRMGYPHAFERLVMVDLPPEERHDLYKDVAAQTHGTGGEVVIHYGDMTRLDNFDDGSFDFVWSGESIEHVDLEAGRRMCAEAFRVLRPGGHFCLDTPNRRLTRMHTGGGFIHPEHQYEYAADELRLQLRAAGFTITQEYGICEMPSSVEGVFRYEDFVLGSPITRDMESAYILYFGCRKQPLHSDQALAAVARV